MNRSDKIILIFIITALWDVVLRFMALGHIHLLGIENMKWVTVLKPYFEYHTLLGAALIAGFVGAFTGALLLSLPVPQNEPWAAIWLFILSGLVGIPMRLSGLFPVLEKHYYEPLGFTYSFITDGLSGIVVGGTYAMIMPMTRKTFKIYQRILSA